MVDENNVTIKELLDAKLSVMAETVTTLKTMIVEVKENQEKLRDDFMTMEKGNLTTARLDIIKLQDEVRALRRDGNGQQAKWKKVFDSILQIAISVLLLWVALKIER